jgi:hypothetical protein
VTEPRRVVRSYLEPFAGADFLGPVTDVLARRDEVGDAAAVESIGPAWSVLAPEIVWDTSPIVGGGREHIYTGFTGFLDYWEEWLALWTAYVYEVDGYEECGGWVVADVRVRAEGREGMPLDMRVGQAFLVEHGLIVRVMAFPSVKAARERLGKA